MTDNKLPRVEYAFENDSSGETGAWRVLNVLQLEEGLSKPYVCELELVQPVEAGKDAVTDPFLGDSCVLSWKRGEPVNLERRLCGIVERVTYRGVVLDEHVVRLEIVPALWTLSQRVNTRMFQGMTAVDIVKKVVEEGLKPYAKRTLKIDDLQKSDYQEREYCIQYRESDLSFVERLLFEEGIAYWFDHSGAGEALVLEDANDSYSATATIGGKAVPMASQHVNLETLASLEWQLQMRPTSVVVRDFDWTQPTVDLTRPVKAKDAKKKDRELYESSPFVTSSDYDGEKYGQEHGKHQAAVLQGVEKAQEQTALGASDVCCLMPGTVLAVTGHGRSDLNGKYLVTRVSHEGSAPTPIRHGVHADRGGPPYLNHLECIPIATVYRPPRPAPRPKIQGPLTAMVVGPDGEEVNVDKHGRVKVQFHWDREGKRNDKSSCWIRVAQSWAGAGFGSMFIPRIGMEVVIDFADGDPDRPLVVGSVYNAKNPLPYTLPDEKTKSYIHTRSSPAGSGRNELCFEDAKGSELIYLHAQKDTKTEVKNEQETTVDHDQTTTVKNDMTTVVNNNQSLTVGVDRKKHVKGNQSATVDVDDETTVKGNQTLTLTGDHERTVQGNQVVAIDGDENRTIAGSYNLDVLAPNSMEVKVIGALNRLVGGPADMEVTGSESLGADQMNKWVTIGMNLGINAAYTVESNLVAKFDQGFSYNDTHDKKAISNTSTIKWSCGYSRKADPGIVVTPDGVELRAGKTSGGGAQVVVEKDGDVFFDADGKITLKSDEKLNLVIDGTRFEFTGKRAKQTSAEHKGKQTQDKGK